MRGIIVVLCTFYLTTFAAARSEGLISCLQNAGATIADVPALLRDVSDDGLRKRGCILACLMQNIGLMNDNVIDAQKISRRFEMIPFRTENMDELRGLVQYCVDNAADDDQCIAASNFANCGLDEVRQYINKILPSASA